VQSDEVIAEVEDLLVVRDARTILSVEHMVICGAERWALLGPNGSGKSTLLSVLAGRLWPTSGAITLLGERVGSVDLRILRGRLGLMSATLTRQLRSALSAHDAVVTGVDGALEPWWRDYDAGEHALADELLGSLGVGHLGPKSLGVLSEGERARVLLARVLIAEPELLCLDEPAAGLDLGAREELLVRLGDLFSRERRAPVVLVTHHLEELPRGVTHAMLLRDGSPVAAGEIDRVLTSELVSRAFDIDVEVTRHPDGRLSARASR
jgi:iron complex transport system ATP-binding protein